MTLVPKMWDFYYCPSSTGGPNYDIHFRDSVTGEYGYTMNQFSTPLTTAQSQAARELVREFIEEELLPLLSADVGESVTMFEEGAP